jgi:hypothetical protein
MMRMMNDRQNLQHGVVRMVCRGGPSEWEVQWRTVLLAVEILEKCLRSASSEKSQWPEHQWMMKMMDDRQNLQHGGGV